MTEQAGLLEYPGAVKTLQEYAHWLQIQIWLVDQIQMYTLIIFNGQGIL